MKPSMPVLRQLRVCVGATGPPGGPLGEAEAPPFFPWERPAAFDLPAVGSQPAVGVNKISQPACNESSDLSTPLLSETGTFMASFRRVVRQRRIAQCTCSCCGKVQRFYTTDRSY